jgi:hypothetical protein
LSNARLIPDAKPGEPDGSTDLAIVTVVKGHPILAGKKRITLGRYVPPAEKESVEYLVFAEIIDGRIDPYRGMPVESRELVDYLVGSVDVMKAPPAKRLGFYFGYLDHKDLNISGDAYKEFAAAPYKDVLAAANQFDAQRLVRWLTKDKDTPSYRIGLYGLLLGVCGKSEHAKMLRELVEDSQLRPLTGVDGLLGGLCVLDRKFGPDYVVALLNDAKQDFNTRYAALRTVRFLLSDDYVTTQPPASASGGSEAKSSLGSTTGEGGPPTVDRTRILERCTPALFIADMADLIIDEFRKHQHWAPVNGILELYADPKFDLQVVRRAVIRYALKCPDPKAKSFVAGLRQSDPQLVADVEEILKFEEAQQVPLTSGK